MHPPKETNHPIIIGVGQVTHRKKIPGNSITSIDLAQKAIEACITDTGRPDILDFVDALSVVSMFSESKESPRSRICEKIGINPAIVEETAIGGNNPQWLVNRAADKIMAGELKVALLVGGEALAREGLSLAEIVDLRALTERYKKDPAILGDQRLWASRHEMLHRADVALHIYPFFENALRQHLQMSMSEHAALMKTYFKNMAAAAVGNPYAWFNEEGKWDNITQPTATNPVYNFPYTKYMNPIAGINQAAAVLVTDTDTARKLKIPQDKWVYLHGSADAHDKWYISERVNYHSSPVVRFTAEAALKSADLKLSDIDFFDLYSCFPCAVLIAAREIGLPITNLPPLSITGGLSFFGGPGNNYTMHSIAHAVERLRKYPAEYGFISGIGHNITKYSIGIYSGIPPGKPWRSHESQNDVIQKKIDALKNPVLCEHPNGPATVETYTVLHDLPDGIPWPIIIARLDSGERCFATTPKGSDLFERMEKEEFIGSRVFVTAGDSGPNIFQ